MIWDFVTVGLGKILCGSCSKRQITGDAEALNMPDELSFDIYLTTNTEISSMLHLIRVFPARARPANFVDGDQYFPTYERIKEICMEYISYERQGGRITSYLLVITFLLFHFISAYGQCMQSGKFITLTFKNSCYLTKQNEP